MNWILLSFIAILSFSVMVMLISVLAKRGLSISFILLGLFTVAAICYGIQTAVSGPSGFQFSLQTILLLIVIGMLSFIGNYAQFQASTTAPNPGLAIAIVSTYSGLVALLSVFFFKDKLNVIQLIGLVVGIIGVGMIAFGSSSKKETSTPLKIQQIEKV